MPKRKLSKKEESSLKNKAGAVLLIALFYGAVGYWTESTKRQKINIVIWWTITLSFGISENFNLPDDFWSAIYTIYALNILWGINNLMVRHAGYSFRQGFIKNHTNFPIPNSPRFNTWFMVIFWIVLLTFTYLSYNEIL